jgi:TonB family protein
MIFSGNHQAAIAFLIDWTAKTTVLLALASVAAFVLRRRSAALRHQIWAIAIAVSLALPCVSIAVPAWHVISDTPSPQPETAAVVSLASSNLAPVSPPAESRFDAATLIGLALLIWTLGSSLLLLRLLAGLTRLWRISAYSKGASEDQWAAPILELRKLFGVSRPVRLLESASRTMMPMTWGIFRPRIVLPSGAGGWNETRRLIVLSHELAHVRRNDWLLQICAEALRACFWFHPLAWIAANRLRQESERACDDAVLNSGIAAPEYASQLLALAQTLKTPGWRFSLALAIARPSNLERRFAAMLDSSTNRNPLSRRASFVFISCGACLLLPIAALTLSAAPPRETPQSSIAAQATYTAKAPAPIPAQLVASARTTNFGPKSANSDASAAERSQITSESTGGVAGTVSDPRGAFIPNTDFFLTDALTNAQRQGKTDAVGHFSFDALPVAQYKLHVSVPGFKTFDVPISVVAGRTSSVDVRLQLGDVSQMVTVEASRNSRNNMTTIPGPQCESVAKVPPASPARPAAPGRIPIGGNVEIATLMCEVRPIYPDSARGDGTEGTVTIAAVIGKDGTLLSPNAINADLADARLAQAALDAVRQWRYRPALLDGEPVEVVTQIAVVFALTNGNSSTRTTPSTAPVSADSQSTALSTSDLAKEGVTILSPTQGVNFNPYIKALLALIRSHWYQAMPKEATDGNKGKVSAVFTVQPKGGLSAEGVAIETTSGVDVFDKAAIASIQNSLPFDPLPQEFHGPYLKLRLYFLYNEKLDAISK